MLDQCPEKRYYHYTKDMFEIFKFNMLQKVLDIDKLPLEIVQHYELAKVVYRGGKFDLMSDEFITDNCAGACGLNINRIVKFLNKMLDHYGKECFSNFIEDIPIVFKERDDMSVMEIGSREMMRAQNVTSDCSELCAEKYYKSILYNAPIMSFSKETSDIEGEYLGINKPIFPDPYILDEGSRSYYLRQAVEGSQEHPWEEKENIAFWRGHDGFSSRFFHMSEYYGISVKTMVRHTPQNLMDKLAPRYMMALLASKNQDYLDVHFSNYGFGSSFDIKYALLERGYDHNTIDYVFSNILKDGESHIFSNSTGYFETIPNHMKYKYLIVVDGWTTSWGRPEWILKSNSLLLKQESSKIDWYTKELVDGTHYKKISKYITDDLINVIEWARNNDEEAKKISEQGTIFADEHFSDEALYETVYTILSDYYDAINTSIAQNTSYNDLNNSYSTLNHTYSLLLSDYHDAINTSIAQNTSYNKLNNSYNTLNYTYSLLLSDYYDVINTSIVQNTSYNDLNNSYNTLNHTYSLLLSDYYDAINTSIVQNTSYNDLNNSYNTLNYTYSLLDQSTSYIKKILLPVVGAVSAIAGVSLGAVSVFLIYKYKHMYGQYNSKTLMDDRFSSTEGSIDEMTSFIRDNIKDVSPIGISLGRQPIELITLDNSLTYFDFNGKGKFCRTSWIGSKDAFLFYNYDNNISSNHYSKIVLTYWSKLGANSDFEALLEVFDDNQDQEFNSLDSAYKKFGIWQDKNSNGQAEEDEFMTLEEAGIINIDFKQMQDIVLDDTIITTADVIWKDNDMTTIAYDLALHYTQ